MIIVVLWSLFLSSMAVLFFSRLAKTRPGALGALALSVLGIYFAQIASLPVVLQMLGTFVASAVCLVFNPRRAIVVGLMVTAMVVGYAATVSLTLPRLLEFVRQREQFPLESLSERLAYEHAAAPRSDSAPPQLSRAVEVHLAKLESDDNYSHRPAALRDLHERYLDSFIQATGFGPVRMMSIYHGAVVLDDAGPVALPDRLARQPDSASGVLPAADSQAAQELPDRSLLAEMHDTGLRDLFNHDRLGYVKDVEHVAGFQSHRFTQIPKPANDPELHWTLTRLELIGLLKYDRPKAYVSENLPRLDELGVAATRDVDEFERSALDRLAADEDLVIDQTPGRIRMLGSLRAGKDCLQCHDVHRGQLLGALSYEIVPVGPRSAELAGP